MKGDAMDIHTIPAGYELNVLVAEKVMGWSTKKNASGYSEIDYALMGGGLMSCDHGWSPSTEIADALKVAEKIGLLKNCRHLHQHRESVPDTRTLGEWEWVVEQVLQPVGENTILGRGETAQLAICRAALEVAREDEFNKE